MLFFSAQDSPGMAGCYLVHNTLHLKWVQGGCQMRFIFLTSPRYLLLETDPHFCIVWSCVTLAWKHIPINRSGKREWNTSANKTVQGRMESFFIETFMQHTLCINKCAACFQMIRRLHFSFLEIRFVLRCHHNKAN